MGKPRLLRFDEIKEAGNVLWSLDGPYVVRLVYLLEDEIHVSNVLFVEVLDAGLTLLHLVHDHVVERPTCSCNCHVVLVKDSPKTYKSSLLCDMIHSKSSM